MNKQELAAKIWETANDYVGVWKPVNTKTIFSFIFINTYQKKK